MFFGLADVFVGGFVGELAVRFPFLDGGVCGSVSNPEELAGAVDGGGGVLDAEEAGEVDVCVGSYG